MNDKIKQLISWLQTQSVWVKIVSLVVTLLCCIVLLFSCVSCGLTRSSTKVRNMATGTTTTITQSSTGGTTSITISPNTSLSLDSTKLFNNGSNSF